MKKFLTCLVVLCALSIALLGTSGVAEAHALPTHPHHHPPFGFGYGYGYGVGAPTTTGVGLTASQCQLVLSFLEARSTQTQQEAANGGITQLLVNCIDGASTAAPVVPSSPFNYYPGFGFRHFH